MVPECQKERHMLSACRQVRRILSESVSEIYIRCIKHTPSVYVCIPYYIISQSANFKLEAVRIFNLKCTNYFFLVFLDIT